jgi:oligoendopeptidase F
MMTRMPSQKTEEKDIWSWNDIQNQYDALEKEPLSDKTMDDWLLHWTEASELCDERYNRLYVATTINTLDVDAKKSFEDFMEDDFPHWRIAEQRLKEKLLASKLEPAGMSVPLRNMNAETQIFREANLPLLSMEEKLATDHDGVMGSQSVVWQGEERTVRQMEAVLREPDRATRRECWEKLAERQLKDRENINQRWVDLMRLRQELAANADFSNYRSYRWEVLKRFDYTPDDCIRFHQAIEDAVVPAVDRAMERRKKKLGTDSLRYYDLFVDLSGQPPLRPFASVQDLKAKASSVFHHVHPQFGEYFNQMEQEGLLDLDNRKHKAAGGYCTDFSHSKRPFIFANAVGTHEDVQTLMHEGGHAFHAFESFKLPYFQQRSEGAVPTEFAEVASMAMEYLTSPYLGKTHGGFYSAGDAARARVDHIETDLRFWPYMAIVDAFQHWVYENPQDGAVPEKCDAKWAELERHFRPYIDWQGYEDVMMTGWQRKDHIHQMPFYYMEYGLALLGAVQIWRKALQDQAGAVACYRQALGLGGTATLPELFQTAGAKLAFDASTLQEAAGLMLETILEFEAGYAA